MSITEVGWSKPHSIYGNLDGPVSACLKMNCKSLEKLIVKHFRTSMELLEVVLAFRPFGVNKVPVA